MSEVQVSRSNAVSGADDVAQLRDLREIGVPEKGHDSRADIIHSCRFAGVWRNFAICRVGVAVDLGRRRMLMWGRAAATKAGQTRLLGMKYVRRLSDGLHCRSRVISRLQCG
jgi:hypothetical protein